MRAEVTSAAVRSRRRRRSTGADFLLRRVLPVLAIAGTITLLVGLAYAGSPERIASGVRIDGVDVGGLTRSEATRLLEQRAASLRRVPVLFTAGTRSWLITPARLGVRADWRAAIDTAFREGGGTRPFRGLRRIEIRLLGADVAPPLKVYRPALEFDLRRVGAALDSPRREPALELRGNRPVLVPGRRGSVLDREAAESTLVRALAGLSRRPVALPVRIVEPRVTAPELAPAAAQVRRALSGPVRLALGDTRWRLSRWRLRELLSLPREGARELTIAGSGADAFFKRLRARVDRPAVDAGWDVSVTPVRVVPDEAGRALEVRTSAQRILAAAVSPRRRFARLSLVPVPAERTTAEARALGIVGSVGSYSTEYGGEANRIHNVQLVSRLIDGHLIAPGDTFSFNGTTGERSAERGFREAPVIINGELQTGLGGGVCQVSTTVFNAAYEAGLRITERTNHALYISHYPLGRDATVNYPDLDLKFVNDTGNWLLLRTFVGSSSLTVGLYGTPVERKVVTETSPLTITGPAPVTRVRDPSLAAGTKVLDEAGEPSRSTSVRRRVYDDDGELLHDDRWYSSYRGEKRIVRVGTKERAKPQAKKEEAELGSPLSATTPESERLPPP